MALQPGDKLGHYEILSLLGKGGMGEVYRGRDTKLKRDVAIKVLPETFARDAERMARFQREAEVLASLNHTNIAAIYGVEDRALVMELVEGASPKGPLPFDEAWKIAAQIAAALEYAHDKGIIHRDLKPANIMVTPEGVVKLLDFGLAKAFSNRGEARTAASDSPENSPTLTIGATEVGVILGTAAYMPPEQAKGKAVDKRADIWSFGVVLYELLTGERLFKGEDVSDTLAQVLTKEPDLGNVPPKARKLLSRCLEKDPKKRLRDIGEAAYLLDDAPATAPSAPRHTSWLPWCIAAFLLLALMPANILHFRETPPVQKSVRFEILPPEKSQFLMFKLSPDGKYLAFVTVGGTQVGLWLRALDSAEARLLPGTEGATYPFWSPDSANLGFFAQGKLKRMALSGGPAVTICDAANGRGAAWNADGVIIFAPDLNTPLQRVADTGSTPVPVYKDSSARRFPEFLPDGKHFLYSDLSPDSAGLWVGSLDGAASVRLSKDVTTAAYVSGVSGGYILFRRDNTLMAQAFDPGTLKVSGGVIPVAERIGPMVNTGSSAFSASPDGTLAFRPGSAFGGISELVWLDHSGKRVSVVTKPDTILSPSLSPDGKTVAFTNSVQNNLGNIWLQDLIRGSLSRFTFEANAGFPVWSPDGSHVAYSSSAMQASDFRLYQKPANGAGQAELILKGGVNTFVTDWSRDGKFLAFSQTAEKSGNDLWLLPMEGASKPVSLLRTSFNEQQGQFSPDGKWVSYTSDESGVLQVYVIAMPATPFAAEAGTGAAAGAGGGGKFQISTAGGTQPRWSRDGKELFYVEGGQRLMAVPVKTGSAFKASAPHLLFETAFGSVAQFAFTYQPSADGQRFLVNVTAGGEGAASAPPITIVTNWQAGLKK